MSAATPAGGAGGLPALRVDVVTTFPDYLAPLHLSLLGRAEEAGVLSLAVHDLRDHASGVHRAVDDAPFGGGAGMLMTPEPWGRALDRVLDEGRAHLGARAVPHLLVPTPGGHLLTQERAAEWARAGWLVLACGRYEGIDERVVDEFAQRVPLTPVSIGDYVLAGGEAAALVIVEAVARLVPGVLGNRASLEEESHADGLLEYPAYTRPSTWRGRAVPEVLLSGDHGRVARWRREQSLLRTARRRPDLLDRLHRLHPERLDAADRALLAAAGWVPPGAGGARA